MNVATSGKSPGVKTTNGEQWGRDPTWRALGFSRDRPHRISFEYVPAEANVDRFDPGSAFTVNAYGDLDCDGVYPTYSLAVCVEDEGLPNSVLLQIQALE